MLVEVTCMEVSWYSHILGTDLVSCHAQTAGLCGYDHIMFHRSVSKFDAAANLQPTA